MNELIPMYISAIATLLIAVVTYQNFLLIKKINKQDKEFQEKQEKDKASHQSEIKDLYEAIVISNLLSGPSSYGALTQAIDAFKSQYKGTVKIFE